MTRPTSLALLLAAALFLAGCDSDEERAERFYQSALSLLEEGDIDRALVELRNVFQADGFHKEARQLYADTVLARGDVGEAYGQYLRLIEQYPDTVAARLILAELALDQSNWEEFERHGTAAIALDAADPRSRAIAAALAYRTAVTDSNAAGEAEALAAARAVLAEAPGNLVSLRILIDATMRGRTPEAALPLIEQAIAAAPTSIEYQVMKFRILGISGDEEAAGVQLEQIYQMFPDNAEIRQTLITWYLSRQEFDAAEALLRQLAENDPADPAGYTTLVQFLAQARGAEAAMAELDRLIALPDQPNADIYRSLRAAMVYEAGDREAAMTTLQEIIDGAEPSDEIRRVKNMLARMLAATDNQVGARALVEEIIAEDATNVDALKLRATWLIAEDKPDAAINDLRTALSQSPRDADILTLMAQAHERAGSTDLAGERLAMAVEVSGSAPDEALRYVRFLSQQGRTQAAESVLLDARRGAPANLDILAQLADLRLKDQNWAGVQEVTLTLETLNTTDSVALAQRIRAAALIAQNRAEDGLALLQQQLSQSDDPVDAAATIALAQIRTGKFDEARTFLEGALAENPDALALRTLDANVTELLGDLATAETLYRAIIADHPQAEAPARMLFALLNRQDQPEAAEAVLDAALSAQPDSTTLLWIKAGLLEKRNDIDGAIALYEGMYAQNTDNVIVANNLASLISTHKTDPESLERAFAIARRLRTQEVPAFQDTYGWIESRRGNHEEALRYLEPAAAGLPNDPLVQYHLGMTYAALGRSDAARIALSRALEIAGDNPLPQFEIARQTLAGLPAAGSDSTAGAPATDPAPDAGTDPVPEAETGAETGAETDPAPGTEAAPEPDGEGEGEETSP
jgi:cellulose synthase operon protein C